MTHRVVFSPRADIDLEREADAVASLNPRAAEQLIEEIAARCVSLAEFPLRFRARDDLAPGLHMTVIRD